MPNSLKHNVNLLTNRYTAIDSNSITHDAAGNLTLDKDGYHYVYDYENRVTRIYKLNGQTEVNVAEYVYDALGNVVALSKFDSGVGYASFVEKYSYSAFGETTVTLNGSTGNSYMFTGRELDTLGAGSWQLYYYRARFYNPQIGRFLQTDPVGYKDSYNFYQYCLNNPINYIDPDGKKEPAPLFLVNRVFNHRDVCFYRR